MKNEEILQFTFGCVLAPFSLGEPCTQPIGRINFNSQKITDVKFTSVC